MAKIDWDDPRYPISTSAQVAGDNLHNARKRYQDGHLFGHRDLRASAKGSPALVTARSILAHAIAVQLGEMNCPSEIACAAARQFTDFASPLESDRSQRDPGELFGGGHFTALVVYPGGSTEVLCADRAELLTRVFFPRATGTAREEKAWILMLDFIVKRVTLELQGRAA